MLTKNTLLFTGIASGSSCKAYTPESCAAPLEQGLDKRAGFFLLYVLPSFAFTCLSPSAFPICPWLSHIRSVAVRIQNMSAHRLVTELFFNPPSSVNLSLPLFPASVNNWLWLRVIPSGCSFFSTFSSLQPNDSCHGTELKIEALTDPPCVTEPLSFNFQIPAAP